MIAEQLAATNPRKLQQLRRIDRAAGQNHFGLGAGCAGDPILSEGDADGPLALEQHAAGQGARLYPQVGATHHRMQVGHRR